MPQFQTLVEALQLWAQEKPDNAAVIFRDKHHKRTVITWSSLHTLAGRFAAVLRGMGLARGAFIINTLPNSPERVVCEAGIWMSGATSVNGNCLLADGSDLLHTVRKSAAPFILLDPDVVNSPWDVLKDHVTLDDEGNVTSSSLPLKKVLFVCRVENKGEGDFLGRLEVSQDWFQADDITPDDVLSIFTTSGTTGFSKLVIHSHKNVIGYLQNNIYVESFLKQRVQFNLTPLGWIGGSLPLFVVPGVTRVTCDMRAGFPDDMVRFIWRTIQEEECSSARFSPMYMPGLVDIAERESQSSESNPSIPPVWKLTTILMTGVPVNRALLETGLTLSKTVCVMYGATDAGTVAAHVVTDSQKYVDHDAGKPFPGIELKIVSCKNNEKELPVNQVGEILIKTPILMKGYLNDPQKTAEAFTKDGFLRTGDMGRLDKRGHLIAEGRGSDAIMRGDYIFIPSVLERRINTFPGVYAAIITGVPDPYLSEELCACVVLESDAVTLEKVRQYTEKISKEGDPSAPRPKYYLKFESFPLTDTGKPRRKMIKAQATERLGLA